MQIITWNSPQRSKFCKNFASLSADLLHAWVLHSELHEVYKCNLYKNLICLWFWHKSRPIHFIPSWFKIHAVPLWLVAHCKIDVEGERTGGRERQVGDYYNLGVQDWLDCLIRDNYNLRVWFWLVLLFLFLCECHHKSCKGDYDWFLFQPCQARRAKMALSQARESSWRKTLNVAKPHIGLKANR